MLNIHFAVSNGQFANGTQQHPDADGLWTIWGKATFFESRPATQEDVDAAPPYMGPHVVGALIHYQVDRVLTARVSTLTPNWEPHTIQTEWGPVHVRAINPNTGDCLLYPDKVYGFPGILPGSGVEYAYGNVYQLPQFPLTVSLH